jgi:hypothetical protein
MDKDPVPVRQPQVTPAAPTRVAEREDEHDEDHEDESAADFDAVWIASQVSRKGSKKPAAHRPDIQSKLPTESAKREGQRNKSAKTSTAALKTMARRAALRINRAVKEIEKINITQKKLAAGKKENPMGTSHWVKVVDTTVSKALAEAGIEELSTATNRINIESIPPELGQVRQAFNDLDRELDESKQQLGIPAGLEKEIEDTKATVTAKASAIKHLPGRLAGAHPVPDQSVQKGNAASLDSTAMTECLAAAYESVMSLRLGMNVNRSRGIAYDTLAQIKQSLATAELHLRLLSHLGVSARDKTRRGEIDVLRAELEQLLAEQANTAINEFESEWKAFRTIAKQVIAKVKQP